MNELLVKSFPSKLIRRINVIGDRVAYGLSLIPIAFLHLDYDCYTSVKLCLDAFYKSVVPGGAVVFDDYGFWSGCRRAVDEFLAKHLLMCT